MMVFECNVCRASLSATEKQAGMLVACPTCHAKLRVPVPEMAAAIVETPEANVAAPPRRSSASPPLPSSTTPSIAQPTSPPNSPARQSARPPITRQSPAARNPGKRYGFNCVYCSSRLEATEAMAAQEGQCPTCGNTITIPILDRYGRLIDPITQKIIKQDPHPVHAYAAAGERAPRIVRESQSLQSIQCPRCSMKSPITSNNCSGCGMPFTMEGTTVDAAGGTNSFCVASLVLGIIAVPTGIMLVTPVLALVFGAVGYRQVREAGEAGRGGGLAIAGMVLGVFGLGVAIYYHFLF